MTSHTVIEPRWVISSGLGKVWRRKYKSWRVGGRWAPVWQWSQLTHGFELPDELLFAPLGPLLPVCVDGAEDRTTWLPTIINRWHVQVVHQHNVRVLRQQDMQRKPSRDMQTWDISFTINPSFSHSETCSFSTQWGNYMDRSIYTGRRRTRAGESVEVREDSHTSP